MQVRKITAWHNMFSFVLGMGTSLQYEDLDIDQNTKMVWRIVINGKLTFSVGSAKANRPAVRHALAPP